MGRCRRWLDKARRMLCSFQHTGLQIEVTQVERMR